MPSYEDLGFPKDVIEQFLANYCNDVTFRGAMKFLGGEDAALARIEDWMFRKDRLREYFDIRNGMLGEGYSSKLSPWLANGCVSPR
jgi:deoxyribodipyrimidine photo-lyase